LTFALNYGKIHIMKKEYIECGKVCSAHGVRGIMKIEPWCDSPRVLAEEKRVFVLTPDGRYLERGVISASVSGRFVLMAIEGVDSREAAQAEKNRILYLHRDDIPVKAGAVLIADMIGLPVIDVDTGRVYGTLSEVSDGVRNKLYTVSTESGEVIIPGVSEFIKEIDTERGVFIHTIPGFFD